MPPQRIFYEFRQFSAPLTDEQCRRSPGDLLNEISDNCIDTLGGLMIPNSWYPSGEKVETRSYVVGGLDGSVSYVKNSVDLEWGTRNSIIANLAGRSHQKLLAALHDFYNGRMALKWLDAPGPIVSDQCQKFVDGEWRRKK